MFCPPLHVTILTAGDELVEGEAAYRLGQAYEKNGDSERALSYLNSYLDTCQSTGNSDGIGKACEAIAKSYERQAGCTCTKFLTFLTVCGTLRPTYIEKFDGKEISR